MRVVETKIYTFNELSEDAKKKAIAKLYDINVMHNWWDNTYEDAKNIGLKIDGFELDRNRHCSGNLEHSLNETSDLILENHGEECQTTVLAITFRSKWDDLVEEHSNGIDKNIVNEGNEIDFDQEADELEKEFEKDLLNEYSNMLQRESDYLMTDEAIKDTILCNEYEFTVEGNQF